uniref:Uncharacterized protein n=1 Tax=Physcomitrium patens TaxID=3218 RepID=A0A2K1ISM6_PHYPA|nr:hypothetical protein PHYPA_026407 [Physcomitrium patens]
MIKASFDSERRWRRKENNSSVEQQQPFSITITLAVKIRVEWTGSRNLSQGRFLEDEYCCSLITGVTPSTTAVYESSMC